jgi:hypothetical protein
MRVTGVKALTRRHCVGSVAVLRKRPENQRHDPWPGDAQSTDTAWLRLRSRRALLPWASAPSSVRLRSRLTSGREPGGRGCQAPLLTDRACLARLGKFDPGGCMIARVFATAHVTGPRRLR